MSNLRTLFARSLEIGTRWHNRAPLGRATVYHLTLYATIFFEIGVQNIFAHGCHSRSLGYMLCAWPGCSVLWLMRSVSSIGVIYNEEHRSQLAVFRESLKIINQDKTMLPVTTLKDVPVAKIAGMDILDPGK